ncbi:MAG: hypothetical protein PWR00_673, partial [Thermovirga sp.]|nr:hypothetical protein [Thermovirga sp.]
ATTVDGSPHLDAVNEGHLAIWGMEITIPKDTGLSAPLCAVIEPPGKSSIFIVNPSGSLKASAYGAVMIGEMK